MSLESVQKMLEMLVKNIVEHPEEVGITSVEGENTVVFEVQLNSEDTGKVIGKKGKTINALRTILRSSADNGDKKIMMEIVE